MEFFRKIRESRHEGRVFNKLLKSLRPMIERLFGKCEEYTSEQAASAVPELGSPSDYIRYGISIYCGREEYEEWAAANSACDYRATRTDIANRLFKGNIMFTPQDVHALIAALNKPDLRDNGSSSGNYDGAMGFGGWSP